MCPWGLSPEDLELFPAECSQEEVLWGGGGRREEEGLCYSASQEKVLYIYFNEEGNDVNKFAFVVNLFSCPYNPTSDQYLLPPSNPGCKCFPTALSLCNLWVGRFNPPMMPQRGKGCWMYFFWLFCSMSYKNGKLAFVPEFLNGLCLVEWRTIIQKSGGKWQDWIISSWLLVQSSDWV